MPELIYETKGVCSSRIHLQVENGILIHASFEDGCDGNAQGVCRLVEGMPVKEVIQRLQGIRCEDKDTSCPDQLARALEKLLSEEETEKNN
ncbi:MAG TPA: TIGR03905 family TSCPD domain-containing protein [Bacillota bacterium]|nr:TIGR03905 family TSCPD domain-containing protein [Bacillota bacterium]